MRSPLSRFLIPTAAVAALTAASLAAQQDMFGPAEQLKKLEPLVGTWQGTGKVVMQPGAPAMEWTSTSTCEWVLGGHALRERAEIDLGPMGKLAFTNYHGWDAERQRYTLIEISNMGSIVESEVTWLDDTTSVYTTQMMEMGTPAVDHWVTKLDGDKVEFHGTRMFGAGEPFVHVSGSMQRTSAEPTETNVLDASFMADMGPGPKRIDKISGILGSYEMKGWMQEPGQERIDVSGHETYREIYGGAAIASEFTADGGAGPGMPAYVAHGYMAWNDHDECYDLAWISNDGEITVEQCRLTEDGALVMTQAGTRQGTPIVTSGTIHRGEDGKITKYAAYAIPGAGAPM